MRTFALITLFVGPAILIHEFFPEVGLVYTGVMAILAVVFFHEILFH